MSFSTDYFQNRPRALIYDHVGCKAQARREFERLYAEDPSFEDLRQRLGFVANTAAPTATFSAD
jgi:regulator of sirC expression with transglutaminase-like and TPR domain